MQARWMQRKNEETGQEEIFYPITHVDAIVDLDNVIQENIESSTSSLTSHIENTDIHFSVPEREKLNTVEEGANKIIVDEELSSTSSNPVQNQIITNWLADNVKNYVLALDGDAIYLMDEKALPVAGDSSGEGSRVIYFLRDYYNNNNRFGVYWENVAATPVTLDGYGIIDAESKGTAAETVNTHNTSASSHNDIRDLISDLSTQVNNFLDVDDDTKDQLSEVITLIENNSDFIEGITTSKVNVSDIINNLTTNVTNKPLSAAQGVAIKSLIDTLQSSLNSEIASRENADTQSVNTAKSYTDTKIANQTTETWTFTLEDGTTVTKKVVVM